MKKSVLACAAFVLAFSFSQLASANDLGDIMKQIGVDFNDLKKAVKTRGDLSEATKLQSQNLSALLIEAVPMVPYLDDISKDPKEQQRLLALFHKLMAETLAASYDVEMNIVTQDLEKAKAGIDLLAKKRLEAHDIFRKE